MDQRRINSEANPTIVYAPYVTSRDGCCMVCTKGYLWNNEYGQFDHELFEWYLRTYCSDYDFSHLYPNMYDGYETHFK